MGDTSVNLGTPVHGLPPETLCSIFDLYLADNSAESSGNKGPSPLLLGAVCGRWREIAWHHPQIWNTIDFCLDFPNLAQRCNVAKKWLVRSAPLPVSIKIYTAAESLDKKSQKSLNDFISLANRHANRWKSLDIALPGQFHYRFHGGTGLFPILQQIRMYDTSGERNRVPFNFEQSMPCPKEVALRSVALKAVKISWAHVTDAEVIDLSIQECLEILECAPALISYHIGMIYADEIYWRSGAYNDVNHPLLTNLEIYSGPEGFIEIVLSHIQVPNLQRLSFDNYMNLPYGMILSLLARSGSQLQELVIVQTGLDDEEFISFLQAIPSLCVLDLCPPMQKYNPQALFRHLADTSSSKHLFLPELRIIRYSHWSTDWETFWPSIPSLFGSLDDSLRRELNHVLIRIDENDVDLPLSYIDKDTLQRLRSIQDAGLKIEVVDPDTGLDFIGESLRHHGITLAA